MSHYKIIVETTNSQSRAQERQHFLQQNNITSDIKSYDIDTGKLYSVQAGPFSSKKPALENVDKIKRLGVINAFITSESA